MTARVAQLVRYPVKGCSGQALDRVRVDLAGNTGNLSPLFAAALCYLVITVPLTHLVNFIDRRLRSGRRVDGGEPLDDPIDEPVGRPGHPSGQSRGA